MVVPGPGTLRLEQLALLLPHHHRQRPLAHATTSATAPACGRAFLPLRAGGAAAARLSATGAARLSVRVSFTPTGGSTYTRPASVLVYR